MVRSLTIGFKAVAVLALLLTTAFWADSAAAQYPPPTGNLVLEASSTSPATGSVVTVNARATDPQGAPIAGVACTFEIVSQPGTDASIDQGPFYSDVNGIASTALTVGDVAGTIVVDSRCGDLSARVSVVAGAQAEASQLPSTGTGLDSTGGWGPSALALILGVAMIAGLGAAWTTRRWIRS
jgi:hypothetical protein